MAKANNDRTPVVVENPLGAMLESQMKNQGVDTSAAGGGANDMIKNLASSFLKKQQTIMEYDIGQSNSIQMGVVFNILIMWFMHFKLQQVQPLLVSVVNGFIQLAYNPLFQVYILGRNLERPFKAPPPPMMNMQENTPVEENVEALENKNDEAEEKSDDSSLKEDSSESETTAGDDEEIEESDDDDSGDDDEDE